MKKILISLAAFALAFSGLAASPASAATSAAAVAPDSDDLRIVRVGTDAMGADSYSNRNREYVTFKNVSDHAVDIANVLVEDNWAHGRTLANRSHSCNTYKITDLPDNSTTELAAGEYVTVFNGVRAGGDHKAGSEYRLYADSDVDCGTAGQFYNNDADTAWVTTAAGVELAKKSWDWNGGYHVYGH
ncbi:hypothetical protein [Nonomuraea sp. NPDC023979]|uniref:hypothetical protein n=1 Tax=Nonomuraea sp. NPDC023979 TaxID=3154796 RepID=UPI0033CA152C